MGGIGIRSTAMMKAMMLTAGELFTATLCVEKLSGKGEGAPLRVTTTRLDGAVWNGGKSMVIAKGSNGDASAFNDRAGDSVRATVGQRIDPQTHVPTVPAAELATLIAELAAGRSQRDIGLAKAPGALSDVLDVSRPPGPRQPFIMKQAISATLLFTVVGCGTVPPEPSAYTPVPSVKSEIVGHEGNASRLGQEVVMFSLMLLKTHYTFGGKNPAAGLDCSGLVTFVYTHAVDMPLKGNAATLARQGRQVSVQNLRSGDLVFFNTLGSPFSHIGIYLGDGQFIHAPSSRGKVRVDKMSNRYWSQRFEMGRTLLG